MMRSPKSSSALPLGISKVKGFSTLDMMKLQKLMELKLKSLLQIEFTTIRLILTKRMIY
mgnify:CR=1 FL=1